MTRALVNLGVSLFRRYENLLLRAPLRTKMCTSGIISALGDTLCQRLIEKKSSEEHSFKRTLRQSVVSCLYGAPLGHIWFGSVLPKLVAPFTNKPAKVVASVIMDNTLLSAFSITTGVFLLELLKTCSLEQSVQNVQAKFKTIFFNSMKYWCVVSTINHTFVPVHLKVLVGNISGIAWQIYMSYMINANHNYDGLITEEKRQEQFLPGQLVASL